MKISLVINLYFILIIGISSFSQNEVEFSSYNIKEFSSLKDSMYYNRYKSVYKKLKEIANNKINCNYKFELFSFSWNGYSGIEDFSFYRFNKDEGEYLKFNPLDSITYNKIDVRFINDFKNDHKEYFNKIMIDKGYSYGFHRYVVLKENDEIVFCSISYSPELKGFKKRSFIYKYVLGKY